MIGKTLKKPLRLERSVRAGIQAGVFILTVACTVTIAKLGWETFQSRTGTVGGEVLVLPTIILLIYIGWTARKEWTSLIGESEAKKRYEYGDSATYKG